MRHALGAVIFFLFAGAYCTAAIAWSAAVWYLLTTVVHRQPGVRLWSATLGFFPLNIVFRPRCSPIAAARADAGSRCAWAYFWSPWRSVSP